IFSSFLRVDRSLLTIKSTRLARRWLVISGVMPLVVQVLPDAPLLEEHRVADGERIGIASVAQHVHCRVHIAEFALQHFAVGRATVRVSALVAVSQKLAYGLDYLATFLGQQRQALGFGGCQLVEML